MSAQRDRAIDFSVDLQIFGAGNLTFDLQAGTEAGLAARRAAADRGRRRAAEGDDRRFYCLGRCWRFRLGLLLGPHSFLPSRMTEFGSGGEEQRGCNRVARAESTQG